MKLLSLEKSATGHASKLSWPAEKRKFDLLTLEELKSLPQPEWLVKGLFRAESLVVLYGPSGHGKSFVALDWALSIATNRPWFGRKVKQGPVVYVVSEGGRGVVKRVIAWMEERGVEAIGSTFFVLDAVQMTNGDDVKAFLAELNQLKTDGHGSPTLVVLDTFARSFVGGEENSSNEVGVWVEASRQVQMKTGATVMAVHHTGKPKENGTATERGSSALRAAAETMIRVTLDEKTARVTIKTDKQKDDEALAPIHLQTKTIVVGDDEDCDPVTSLVLVPISKTAGAADIAPAELPKEIRPAVEALRGFASGEADSGEWRAAIRTKGHPAADSSFHRWRRKLMELGVVEEVPGTSGRYRVVPAPTEVPRDSHESSPLLTTATPTTT